MKTSNRNASATGSGARPSPSRRMTTAELEVELHRRGMPMKQTALRIMRWRREGPRYLRDGSRILYDLRDVEDWITQVCPPPTPGGITVKELAAKSGRTPQAIYSAIGRGSLNASTTRRTGRLGREGGGRVIMLADADRWLRGLPPAPGVESAR